MPAVFTRVPWVQGVLTKFKSAPSLLWTHLLAVFISVLMACMGSVSAPPRAIQGSQESKRYQACKTPLKGETRQISRKQSALRPFSRLSAGRTLGGRRAMLALVAAVHVDLVEGKWLVELPSGFRCVWNDLPHGVQFAILFGMLGTLYGVNRLFDKADEAMSNRLACATAGLLNERRHHAPRTIF